MQYEGLIADIDETMYAGGIEVLHPGGIRKTFEVAELCGIGKDSIVLDVGSGKGFTACSLVQKYGCHVTGIDLSADMIAYARRKAQNHGYSNRIDFHKADAHNLPFRNDMFDVVFIECVTTLLDKPKAFSEFLRVLKPNGTLGDLEMIWRKDPPERLAEEAFTLFEGFKTFTMQRWIDFVQGHGFVNVRTDDFSDAFMNVRKEWMKQFSIPGILKMSCVLMFRKDLRNAMRLYENLFNANSEYFGYGYFVARKPAGPNDEADDGRASSS